MPHFCSFWPSFRRSSLIGGMPRLLVTYSNLNAVSQYPSYGSFAALATRLIAIVSLRSNKLSTKAEDTSWQEDQRPIPAPGGGLKIAYSNECFQVVISIPIGPHQACLLKLDGFRCIPGSMAVREGCIRKLEIDND